MARRVCLALLLLAAPRLLAQDVFAPYLNDTPPKIVEVVSKGEVDGVEFTRLKWLNRVEPKSGRDVVIYGVLARPLRPGPHPGVLVCHGGGGSADQVTPQVIGWAQKGYVAVAQDQPGICTAGQVPSRGPCLEPGASTFKIEDDATASPLFDGVLAALRGLALLRSQPDVDRSRVGVTGGSWGGYMTTMITGLAGDRVKAAFSVYGCGFYDLGSTWQGQLNALGDVSKQIWLDALDAGRRASGATAAYMVANPANDWFFWPNAVMATLAEMPGPRNVCFMPNDSHVLRQPGGTNGPPEFDRTRNRTWMEQCWLGYHLKGEGQPFPTADQPRVVGPAAGGLRVSFRASGPAPFVRTSVCWAAGELPWRLKWWSRVEAQPVGDGRYEAVLPVDEPDQPIHWFGLVSDERQLSVSTLVEQAQPADHQVTTTTAAGFTQDFEDPAEASRWGKEYVDRRPGRRSVTQAAARTGELGLELRGDGTFACPGVRAATLRRTRATAVHLWLRAAEGTCPAPTIDLLAEEPSGARSTWRWPAGEPLTTTWREVVLPLAEARVSGQGDPASELLSPALGMLRLTTAKEAHLHVDDVSIR